MNIWVLSEERPTIENITDILSIKYDIKISDAKIIPIIEGDFFYFKYKFEGAKIDNIDDIFISIASGKSSFVDFLVFESDNFPDSDSVPRYAVEETKTTDAESRNTGVYQRLSKFVYIDLFYPNIEKYMYFNSKARDAFRDRKPTLTNIFGTKMIKTCGIDIIGRDTSNIQPFNSIEELIKFKNEMPNPNSKNTPIKLFKSCDKIQISGRLIKNGSISHDPNIGALTFIAKTLRILGWDREIEIISHGLHQNNVGSRGSKFTHIANAIGITLEGIIIPKNDLPNYYWKQDRTSEKNASILLHTIAVNLGYKTLYENHAGCERGYFWDNDDNPITVKKKDVNDINLYLPDVVLLSPDESYVFNIEGKRDVTLNQGLIEIENYDSFEKELILEYYPKVNITRWLSIFGGSNTNLHERTIFKLLDDGRIIQRQL